MAKKNRTGLQSKVSHIFAGVPMPKRKRPQESEHPEKKPESKEPEQTIPAEKSPVQTPPEKQPVLTDVSAEKTPAEESLLPKIPTEQEPAEETPVEKMIAPQSQVENTPIIQPPVVELTADEPVTSFNQTIEIPEREEPVKKLQDSVKPMQSGVIEQRTERIPRKIPVISKGKRLTSKSGVSSRRQTTMVILVIALSILLFFLLVKPFSKSARNLAGSGANVSAVPSLSLGGNDKSIIINWKAPDVYPTEIRDPMLPDSDQQFYFGTGTPVIAGISTSNEGEKLAIIRGTGQLVKEGDEIFGWKVKKINPNSVVFEKDGKILELEPQGKK